MPGLSAATGFDERKWGSTCQDDGHRVVVPRVAVQPHGGARLAPGATPVARVPVALVAGRHGAPRVVVSRAVGEMKKTEQRVLEQLGSHPPARGKSAKYKGRTPGALLPRRQAHGKASAGDVVACCSSVLSLVALPSTLLR